MLGKGQQLGHQTLYNENAYSFKQQRLTRLEHGPAISPHFPPGFNPAVRLHSAQEFPALGTRSNKTRAAKANVSNSTSAAGQRSFSLAAAKRNQTPPPPSFSKMLAPSPGPPTFSKIPTRMPPPGLLDRAIIAPPAVTVTSRAGLTAPLPVDSHTAGGGPEQSMQVLP